MKSSLVFLILILSISYLNAAGGGYDYKQNGADWPTSNADCGKTNQSPIDLSRTYSKYPNHNIKDDGFNKLYTNQETSITVEWKNGLTSQVATNKANQDLQTFNSNIAKKVFEADTRFTAVQFHFHSGSEHTIDGKRYDLEMHAVHAAGTTKNGFTHGVMGIIFDVNDYDKSVTSEQVTLIDKFFDELEWDKNTDPSVALVSFGDLMMSVDTNKRWIYSGSLTTPPCSTSIYFNILSTVYPIKQKHLDLFVNTQLARGANDLKTTGNYRVIQKVDNHKVQYVTDVTETKFPLTSVILGVLLGVVTLAFGGYVYMSRSAYKKVAGDKP